MGNYIDGWEIRPFLSATLIPWAGLEGPDLSVSAQVWLMVDCHTALP
jgi:hypothetical protein